MHLKRWLTGIVAIPILIYLIGFGPRWIFYSILYLVSIFALHEFYKIASPDLSKFLRVINYFLDLLLFFFFFRGQIQIALSIICLISIVSMTYFLFGPNPTGEQTTSELGKVIMGPIYICLPLVMLLHVDRFQLIGYPSKGMWVFFLLAVTFANDMGAFYCGRLLGKHLLYESISPKKTWEGAVGGLFFSVIIGSLFIYLFRIYPINIRIIILIVIMSIMGQIGDLAESMFKRGRGIKDSGRILPGHGGMLDRIDSLLFSIPVLYFFLNIQL